LPQPRVCSPCTPHTATASPSATQPGLPELPAQEQYRGINLRQWSSMNDYCNERRGDTTTSINAYLYVPIGDTYASESDDSRDDHCGDLPAFFYTAAKNYFVGNGLYVYMANLCFQNRTLQNSSPFLFTIDSGGIPHQVFPTC